MSRNVDKNENEKRGEIFSFILGPLNISHPIQEMALTAVLEKYPECKHATLLLQKESWLDSNVKRVFIRQIDTKYLKSTKLKSYFNGNIAAYGDESIEEHYLRLTTIFPQIKRFYTLEELDAFF